LLQLPLATDSSDGGETKRYGEYSKPGEFIYDHPFQWGSRRIGPDLAREGGRQSSFWHWTHFENPEVVSPGSVMPAYGHLLTADLKFSAIQPLVQSIELPGGSVW
jgi:cytochrome c oxidase cbb3-type subunit I/II